MNLTHAIDIDQLEVGYEKNIIIPNLNLSIPENQITIIIGPNGCGKSTLLKTIGQVLRPQKGNIRINGTSIREQSPKELAKRMAVLPQSPQCPDGLTVRELVSYGRYPHLSLMSGLKKEDHEIVNQAMEQTGVKDFADHFVSELSGGQRQRAWIALALAQRTDILILDEPTTYLDLANQVEILNLLQTLKKTRSVTVLIVMHELNNAMKYADHLIGMRKGHVLFQGKPIDVIHEENLKRLYDIQATITTSANGEYPICVDYDL